MILIESSCNENRQNNIISIDSAHIKNGALLFSDKCSSCHNINQDGIGPSLGGIIQRVDNKWLHDFIKSPASMISKGDERSKKLLDKYKILMPDPGIDDERINEILSYLNTQRNKTGKIINDGNIINPIKDTIINSKLIATIELFCQVPASSDSGKKPLTRITQLTYAKGIKDPFIVDLRGKLYRLKNTVPTVYMNIAELQKKFINVPGLATGFGSIAFHPDFKNNGLFYTTHTEFPKAGIADFSYPDSIRKTLQWVLTEWHCKDPDNQTFKGVGREIMRADFVSGIHGMQEICFNPLAKPGTKDYGLLYIGVGEGGAVENGFSSLAHNKGKVYGTLLRIDPAGRNSQNGKYGIPKDNPFANNTNGTLQEIYAYGFRNPHRISWLQNGDLIVTNIGHSNIESLNLIVPGADYGWPIREGNFLIKANGNLSKLYPLPKDDSTYHIIYPIAEYDHDEGKAICGGYEYTGNKISALKGKFLFGDIPTGRLFYIETKDINKAKQAIIKEWKISYNGTVNTLKNICGDSRVDLHFGKDQSGEMYILTKADGKIYRIIGAKIQH